MRGLGTAVSVGYRESIVDGLSFWVEGHAGALSNAIDSDQRDEHEMARKPGLSSVRDGPRWNCPFVVWTGQDLGVGSGSLGREEAHVGTGEEGRIEFQVRARGGVNHSRSLDRETNSPEEWIGRQVEVALAI